VWVQPSPPQPDPSMVESMFGVEFNSMLIDVGGASASGKGVTSTAIEPRKKLENKDKDDMYEKNIKYYIFIYIFFPLFYFNFSLSFSVWFLRDVMSWEFVRGYTNPTSDTFSSHPNLPPLLKLNDQEWDDLINISQHALLLSDKRHA
jgi:hypothetical protein